MLVTTYDGLIAKGERKALQAMVIRLASKRCGVPDDDTRQQLQVIEDVAQLENLVESATTASSWQQLLGSS